MREMRSRIFRGLKTCKICGKRIFMQGYDTQDRIAHLMDKKCICYDCAYWTNLILHPPEYLEVVGNQCLRICPMVKEIDETMILGGKGKRRYFMRKDRTVFQSNDVWCIGEIPERFMPMLPHTATEITAKAFKSLNNYNKKCKSRGCYDRYHCFRYRIELEKDKEPFNKVPETWKVGGEHCQFFINFNQILTDDCSVPKQSESDERKNDKSL